MKVLNKEININFDVNYSILEALKKTLMFFFFFWVVELVHFNSKHSDCVITEPVRRSYENLRKKSV